MKLFELINCTTVVPGIPVRNDGTDYWYIEVGVWRDFEEEDEDSGLVTFTDEDDNSFTLHGKAVRVEEGVECVIGADGKPRVFSGQLVYRNNEYVLAPSQDNDDGAIVLFRYDAQPRAL